MMVLIDDQGTFWDSSSPKLQAALETSLTGKDLAEYCVKNLGYVAAKPGDSSHQVWLRPSHVAPTALAAALYWLGDQKSARLGVSYYVDKQWAHEIHGSNDMALKGIIARVNSAQAQRQDAVRTRRRAPQGLPASHPLRYSLEQWRASFGRSSGDQLEDAKRHAVNGRYILLHAPSSSPRIIIKEVGPGMPAGAKHWLSRAVGMRIEDQPDTVYGRLCADIYRHVKDRAQPILDDVDAFVEWPGLGRQRRRYQRLILPFQAKGGDVYVYLLGTSLEDPRIDLRGELR
jgi:hypothetical protein